MNVNVRAADVPILMLICPNSPWTPFSGALFATYGPRLVTSRSSELPSVLVPTLLRRIASGRSWSRLSIVSGPKPPRLLYATLALLKSS